MADLNFLEWKWVFKILANAGVRRVLLTGGEPLVRPDFEELVKELKSLECNVFLDTNADFFFLYQSTICQHVDTIGMPITFVGRSWGDGNFENVITALEHLAKAENRPAIRIGTVITKLNVGEVERIGELIKRYPISIWKLYQFTPQEGAVKNRYQLEIPEEQFLSVAENAKAKFSPFFNVIVSTRRDRNRAYFFVESNGTVTMPVDDGDVCRLLIIGKIFDTDIFQKWQKWVTLNAHIGNAEATFRQKL